MLYNNRKGFAIAREMSGDDDPLSTNFEGCKFLTQFLISTLSNRISAGNGELPVSANGAKRPIEGGYPNLPLLCRDVQGSV